MSQHRSLRAIATWVANATSSSASSGSACSRNAANGKKATASPACAKPSRTPESMRESECGGAKVRQTDVPRFEVPQFASASALNVRLQKFLAEAGVASRRASEQIILEGRVAVNGRDGAASWARKVDPAQDQVTRGRQPVRHEAQTLRGVEQAARICLLAAG